MTPPGAFAPAKIKADCPKCGPRRWANVVGHFSRRDEDEDGYGFWEQIDYRILQCPACEEIFFQTDAVFSEDYDVSEHPVTGEPDYNYEHAIEHWPSTAQTKRDKPKWVDKLTFVDEDISSLLSSVYTALDQDLNVLAAIGVRTVFDRASELLGIDPARSFAEKLSDLVAMGKIGSDERKILDVLTDAGGAAAHRGWRPTPEQLDTMMSIIEAFLYRTFLLGDAAKMLRAKIPKKPKRRKSKTTKLRSPRL